MPASPDLLACPPLELTNDPAGNCNIASVKSKGPVKFLLAHKSSVKAIIFVVVGCPLHLHTQSLNMNGSH